MIFPSFFWLQVVVSPSLLPPWGPSALRSPFLPFKSPPSFLVCGFWPICPFHSSILSPHRIFPTIFRIFFKILQFSEQKFLSILFKIMLTGGLLCERRHSEATPSMKPKPKLSLAVPPPQCCSPIPIHPGSVPLPLLLCSSAPSSAAATPIVLKSEKNGAGGDEGPDEMIEYSGKCIRINNGKYKFWDIPSALVGRGSYGIVFRGNRLAKNNCLERPVAIKRMWRVNVRPDELEAMKRVRNANLVALLDVWEEPGEDLSYLVMELCDTDLDRHLRGTIGGKLVDDDMRVVVESVARGYYALFEKHIVHRDIKPQNILLLYSSFGSIGSAKITDFGVSRVLADENMGLCNVAGTLFYMAPEVGANLVACSEYDHSADIWSIGCLFFQCLTGKTPFDECSLCRLFLYCAGGNFEGYELPELPKTKKHVGLHALICALLQIDRTKRASPRELLNKAISMEVPED